MKTKTRKRRYKSAASMMVWNKVTDPRSGCKTYFTKKGPGVEARAREVFSSLVPWERDVAIEMGWFPADWRDMPVYSRKFIQREPVRRHYDELPGAADDQIKAKKSKPGLLRRIGRFLGFGRKS